MQWGGPNPLSGVVMAEGSHVAALIEQLVGQVLSVDSTEAGLNEVTASLRAIVEATSTTGGALLELAARGLAAVEQAQASSYDDALQAATDLAVGLQELARKEPASAGAQTSAAPEAAPPPAPSPAATAAPAAVVRDEETVALFSDFIGEANDSLSLADEVLLSSSGASTENVHALFRVFHTIKGVAGFLELSQIVALAHVTESVMDQCREGHLDFGGETVELVFRSTGLLRTMVEDVKLACEAGRGFIANGDADAHVEKLKGFLAALDQAPQPSVPAPKAAPAPASAPVPVPPPSSMPVAPAPPPSAPVPAPTISAPLPSAPAAFAPLPSAPPPRLTAPPDDPNASSPPPRPSAGGKLRETVKVDLGRVDNMVEMIGELVIVEAMLTHSNELSAASLGLRNTLGQLEKISRDLQNAAMRMRTVPVHDVFQKMARLTRELSRKKGKDVVLVTQGDGTEMDRSMVEQLEDPLLHMVRNAIDHGIEAPAARVAAGKPAQGVLTLSASHEGGSIVVELSDDGAGLNRDRILAKAVERGLVANASVLGETEIFNLIFEPGFSTAAQVTDVSGRGVGMDVVKRNIENMRGRVSIESTPGKGTTFRLILPLTLAIIDGMLVRVGKERYLVPSLSIVEALQPQKQMVTTIGAHDEVLTVRGRVMPMLRLSRQLDVPDAKVDPTEALVVVVESAGKRVGLMVDEVLAQQQVVIKSLGRGVGRAEFASGAAILSDGCVGLILNIDKLCGLITYRHRVATDAHMEARP